VQQAAQLLAAVQAFLVSVWASAQAAWRRAKLLSQLKEASEVRPCTLSFAAMASRDLTSALIWTPVLKTNVNLCIVLQDDPGNADKHAAYLKELNRSKPHDVVARVESKEVRAMELDVPVFRVITQHSCL
jgi:hypothetical protein